mmetsp:Transcript_13524/g.53617  ORF Transcript_13524/g.53617 Transcript_13524/m.53617 type:complete len:275 (-) Transcript_13524:96-920(-)
MQGDHTAIIWGWGEVKETDSSRPIESVDMLCRPRGEGSLGAISTSHSSVESGELASELDSRLAVIASSCVWIDSCSERMRLSSASVRVMYSIHCSFLWRRRASLRISPVVPGGTMSESSSSSRRERSGLGLRALTLADSSGEREAVLLRLALRRGFSIVTRRGKLSPLVRSPPETLFLQRLQGQSPRQRGQDHVGLTTISSQLSPVNSMQGWQMMVGQVVQGAKCLLLVLSDVWHTWQQVQRPAIVAPLFTTRLLKDSMLEMTIKERTWASGSS